ncbi:hypothetical protein [Clostridium oryzae]|uniref:hypothetical protein n=1 Tax=Clostridium oryzae TaxID=1450648 RepID=UPI00147321E7|nr:hypothetical protein [Clostridium oryzae]
MRGEITNEWIKPISEDKIKRAMTVFEKYCPCSTNHYTLAGMESFVKNKMRQSVWQI